MSVTTKDIARICNVSRTTVNRAFTNTGRISKETKELILKTARELDYKPDLLASSVKKGKSSYIGVVVFDIKNQYFAQMLNAIEQEAEGRGYHVSISLHEKNPEKEREMLQRMDGYRVEGIILSPVSKSREFSDFLKKLKAPVVIVGNRIASDIPYVGIDEKSAAIEAVSSIAAHGYKKIIFVCPPLVDEESENIYSHLQRRDGFCEAVEKYKIDGDIIAEWDYLDKINSLADELTPDTAFFCSGDIYALEIMKSLRMKHKKSGVDYGIMGFDNIDFLDYVVPRLSTIDNSIEAVASKAVDVLLSRIAGGVVEKETIIPYNIVEGDTLGLLLSER